MDNISDQSLSIHRFMLSSDAYAANAQEHDAIEVIETHISWIYLTPKYVYKQKKPVHFEFLDFSSQEKRMHFCRQELALNRRISPQVYIGLSAVTRDASGNYALVEDVKNCAAEQIVEPLVKMRRLNDRATLDVILRSDQVSTAQRDRLAARLTDFYMGQAPAMVKSDDFLQRIRTHVNENQSELSSVLPEFDRQIQFATNAQLNILSLETDEFIRRVVDGRVVDGHGDLRPEHIDLEASSTAIIDCIEFSDEYRINDVIDELCFLSMECDRLGCPQIGETIIDHYVQNSGDSPPSFLVAFYKCYRACVRAKVAALRYSQIQNDNQSAMKECKAYLELAAQYASQLSKPLVIMVGGISGSGKSTLARELQQKLVAELLQTDEIRNDVDYGFSLETDGSPLDSEKYTLESRSRVYQCIADLLPQKLKCSPVVIVDGTFGCQSHREIVSSSARACGARVLQVQCECCIDEAKRRIAYRAVNQTTTSEATPELAVQQQVSYEPVLMDEPLFNRYSDDGNDAMPSLVNRIRDMLRFSG